MLYVVAFAPLAIIYAIAFAFGIAKDGSPFRKEWWR